MFYKDVETTQTMKTLQQLWISFVLLLVAWDAFSAPRTVEIDFYWKPGCYFCNNAKAYLKTLQAKDPHVKISSFNIVDDKQAAARMEELVMMRGIENVGVPLFSIEGSLIMGFGGPESTGKSIEQAIVYARSGSASEEARDSKNMLLPLFGEVHVEQLGLPIFTIIVGLLDGFNPCAMWVLLFLLSLLVNLKDRRRMFVIAGTFVFISGAVYFMFMAAWLNFFQIVGLSKYLQVILGAVAISIGGIHIKDFFAFKKGISLSIPEKAKPGIYKRVNRILRAENMAGAMFAVVTLAIMVNMVELMCTAGLPVVYTQVLAHQELSDVQHYAFLILYNIAYMFDDGIMVAVGVITLSKTKLQEKGGRILKLISGLAIMILGLALIFKPEWLTWN